MIFSIDPSWANSQTILTFPATLNANSNPTRIFFRSAACPSPPKRIVAIVAPRIPSVSPITIAIQIPSSGGPHSAITIPHDPMIIPVAMRGSLRKILSNKATSSAVKGIKIAAKTIANPKSNAYPNPVRRYRPPITTVAAAAASVPQTAPRRASGPGRIISQFLIHHSLIFVHILFTPVQTDVYPPPLVL